MREKKTPKKIRDKTVDDEQSVSGQGKGKAAIGKKDSPSAAEKIGKGGNKGGHEPNRSNSRQTPTHINAPQKAGGH